MKTKIARWGNSVAVRLPKALVDELGLTPGKVVDLNRRGSRLEIETKPDAVRIPVYRIEDLVAEMKRLGPYVEPSMEDWGPDVGEEVIDDGYSRGEITPEDLQKDRDASGGR